MKNILLINKEEVPHYRVPVYNYLTEYLKGYDLHLTIVSQGVQKDSPHSVQFPYKRIKLDFWNLARLFVSMKPDAVVFWLNFEFYKFPVLLVAKILGIKILYWGHGRDLEDPENSLKNIVYSVEHWMDDAIILYAEHLKKYIRGAFLSKTFVANNTLNMTIYRASRPPKEEVKRRYRIPAAKNVICMGRMQRRKRIGDLVEAFRALRLEGVGLILAGPDDDGILRGIEDPGIYKVGPVYGEESLDLLSAADVYCLPGHLGLGIVDAFYCGLPVVTEDVLHAPEIMYLKDGLNGFIVPEGDIGQLSEKLAILLTDERQRELFSKAAREEIMTNGHINKFCEGFRDALHYALK